MKVAILGTGAYGFALASIINCNQHEITMWTFSREEQEYLLKTKKSPKLPEYEIPDDIQILTNIEECMKDKDLIVMAIPAFAFDATSQLVSQYLTDKQHVLIATKGIEQGTCLFLDEVFTKYNDTNKLAVISGPTFAVDIVKQVPIGFSLATKNQATDRVVRTCFANDTTKFRSTNDIIGVEICSSIKNVMAIASGMLAGMNVTDSTRALFLTETLNDIKELIDELGGNKKTILSFAGFGDILMTCTSENSRNFSFGKLIGSGASQTELDEYLKNTTVEGMYTLQSIYQLMTEKQVDIPIISLINEIVCHNENKSEMLKLLIQK